MPNRRFQRFGVTLGKSQNKFGAESDTITEIIWCRKKLFWCRKKTKLVRKKIILVPKREKPSGPFWCKKETFWCWNRSPPYLQRSDISQSIFSPHPISAMNGHDLPNHLNAFMSHKAKPSIKAGRLHCSLQSAPGVYLAQVTLAFVAREVTDPRPMLTQR